MLSRTDSPDHNACLDSAALADTSPQARLLIQLLADCHHPRAGRLSVRLRDCRCESDLQGLRAEVRYLLAMSFGTREADRRLQLQSTSTGLPAW